MVLSLLLVFVRCLVFGLGFALWSIFGSMIWSCLGLGLSLRVWSVLGLGFGLWSLVFGLGAGLGLAQVLSFGPAVLILFSGSSYLSVFGLWSWSSTGASSCLVFRSFLVLVLSSPLSCTWPRLVSCCCIMVPWVFLVCFSLIF